MNDLNNVAPITTDEGDRQLYAFSEPGRSFNSSSPQDSSSCALSATAMLQYTICRRVLETFNEEGIALV